MGTSKLSGKLDEMLGGGGGGNCDVLASHPGGVVILLVASCYGNQVEVRQFTEFHEVLTTAIVI